jgi:multiple sugar transport system substrate-binding protein
MTNVDSWVKSGFSEQSAKEYLKAIGDSFRHPNAIIDLRIPGTAEYFDTMEVYTSQALAKQVSPQAAMAAAAKDWNAITDRLGRDKQKKYYRDSLGLK